MIILAGLIGGLLVTRGLTVWLPFLQGAFGTLLVIVLAGLGIAYQGGLSAKGKLLQVVSIFNLPGPDVTKPISLLPRLPGFSDLSASIA